MHKKVTEETALKRSLKILLRKLNWFTFHNLQSMGSYSGIPDIAAIKNSQVIMIEAKSVRGKQSKLQKAFQEDWEARGGTYLLISTMDEMIEWLKKNGEKIH